MIDHDLADDLVSLAEAIARLKPVSSRGPEVFFEERSELASRARSLASRARTGAPAAAADVPAPVGRQATRHEARHVGGRTIVVLTRRAVRSGS